jgi:hypothetical protein
MPAAQPYCARAQIKDTQKGNHAQRHLCQSFNMLESSCFFDKAFVQDLRELKSPDIRSFVRKFWALSNIDADRFDEFASTAFLKYVADELERVRHHRSLFAVQDFNGTFAIVQNIAANPSRPYRDVLADLSTQYLNVTPEAIRRSIELSFRLWLTLNTSSTDVRVGAETTESSPIDWDLDISLEQLLKNQIVSPSMTPRQEDPSRFDAGFTVAYLVNTCGMRLQWSDDIASHLNFDQRRLVLTVYRHKACLISHLESSQYCPIPKEVLEELLKTLELLFPFGDDATKRLLSREGQQSLYTLGTYGTDDDLDLSHYKYFGAKLGRLMLSFDGTSRTWKQLAFDRRNKLEWSAFWVTVMVALLTVISIPCNIIQATYSVKAYHATLAQGATEPQRPV